MCAGELGPGPGGYRRGGAEHGAGPLHATPDLRHQLRPPREEHQIILCPLQSTRCIFINIYSLGKPSLKKTIFLLTFVNKDFTPPPNY